MPLHVRTMETCLNPVTLPSVDGDSRRLQQVLINLIKNALKFTREGRIEILMSYNWEAGMLIGHVRDTGMGIDRDDLSRLFSRFGKLKRTAEANSDGIGLGLTIV